MMDVAPLKKSLAFKAPVLASRLINAAGFFTFQREKSRARLRSIAWTGRDRKVESQSSFECKQPCTTWRALLDRSHMLC